jgi:rfaE bifunctional protein kinase chain/domain
MPTLSAARLEALLAACRGLRIAVLGDFNLDAYWHVDMTRAELSRETPLYNRPVVAERYSAGGAANVAWNLADLGVGTVYALTVLGHDWRYGLLAGVLAQSGVRLDYARQADGWQTPMFGKVLLESAGQAQEDARIDFVNPGPVPAAAEAALLADLETLLPRLDALVIADYAREGVVSAAVRAQLDAWASAPASPICVADSRHHIGDYAGMVLKPNRVEAAALLCPGRCDPAAVALDELVAAARRFQAARTGERHMPLYITLGEAGCWLFEGDDEPVVLPAVPTPPPCDPVGAGDTFLAALSAGLAAGAAPWEAAALANLAAGVTVRKLHITGTARPGEIADLHKSTSGVQRNSQDGQD